MTNTTRWLSFVLSDDISFDEIIFKLENVFGIKLPYKDDKGRFIAKAKVDSFEINVIDRVDRVSDILCDDYHVIKFVITDDSDFNYLFEKKIKDLFSDYKIKWERHVWSPDPLPIISQSK